MEEQLRLPLHKVLTALKETGIRYAIIGGLAVAVWGIVRNTLDIDIKVLGTNSDYESIREILRSKFPSAARENAPKDKYIFSVMVNNVIVDFFFTLPGYDELIIERAGKHHIDGLTAWICTAEDVIIQKMTAGRPKDYLDVQAVLDVQKGKLDYGYVELWLPQFADLLEKPEILSDYHAMKDISFSRKGI